ncbi:MAG: protein kinase domain-containing protein [Anaerolineae bacterium]
MIGEVLSNRYKILRDLGCGGMAWVYLAEDLQEGGFVAVKVLYPQFGEDVAYIQRFNREAKLASLLSDPHIVRVLDYGASRDVHYLVMEYIEGRTLKDILQERGPLPYRDALEIAHQVAQALEHANRYGIVHRDIKPQNLMLTAEGMVKVLDFGIARAETLPSLTRSGFVGSPYYISPEQALGEKVDIRSDIYSLGIVLYEMLSGDLPFDAKSPWSIISRQIAAEPPPLRLKNSELPKEVEWLVNKALSKRPEERFQTPEELMQTINGVLAGKKFPEAEPGRETEKHPHPRQEDIEFLLNNLYKRAVEACNSGQWSWAVSLFNQILRLKPKYKDAALRLKEAERQNRLAELYGEAQRALAGRNWEEAIGNLKEIIALDSRYKDAARLMNQAQAEQARAQKKEKVIHSIQEHHRRRAFVFLAAFFALMLLGGGAYAYLWRNSNDSLEANYRATPQAEPLGLSLGTKPQGEALARLDWATIQAGQATPSPTYTPTATVTATSTEALNLSLGLKPQESFPAPRLLAPPDGAVFHAGRNEQIILQWEPVPGLTDKEFYNVTVVHFFNSKPRYWGDATRETNIRFPPETNYGEADKDIFHWWVEVRHVATIKKDGKPDGPPVSPKSEAWTFIWR